MAYNTGTGMPGGGPGNVYGLLAVQQNVWNEKDKTATEKTIMDALIQDPIIEKKTNISVSFGDTDKKELHLIGKVGTKEERKRAVQIARDRTPTDVQIFDELVLGV